MSPLSKGRCPLIGCQGGFRPITCCHSVSKRRGRISGHPLVARSFNGVASEIQLPGAATSAPYLLSKTSFNLQMSSLGIAIQKTAKTNQLTRTTFQKGAPALPTPTSTFFFLIQDNSETIHIWLLYGTKRRFRCRTGQPWPRTNQRRTSVYSKIFFCLLELVKVSNIQTVLIKNNLLDFRTGTVMAQPIPYFQEWK